MGHAPGEQTNPRQVCKAPPMTHATTRRVWIVSAVIWSLAACLFLAWVVLVQVSGNIVWCEASTGDSNHGDLR